MIAPINKYGHCTLIILNRVGFGKSGKVINFAPNLKTAENQRILKNRELRWFSAAMGNDQIVFDRNYLRCGIEFQNHHDPIPSPSP
jgi:hypothetical protein